MSSEEIEPVISRPPRVRRRRMLRRSSQLYALRTKHYSGLWVLTRNPYVENIPPVLYLKACVELIFLTLTVSWVLTLIFDFEFIRDNALKRRIGYNNLCVGWDTPPATYVAGMMWTQSCYYAFRFVYLNHVRYLLEPDSLHFTAVANALFGVSVATVCLVLIVPPSESIWMHSLPFFSTIVTLYFLMLALCLEDWDHVTTKGKLFLAFYGFVSFAVPLLGLSEFYYYDQHGVKSPWPWQITMFVDYSWFLCLAGSVFIIPSVMVIVRTLDIVPKSEMHNLTILS